MAQQALFPTGFGLSFARFAYSDLRVEKVAVATGPSCPPSPTSLSDPRCAWRLSVAVANVGDVAGAETVLFLHSLWVSQAVRWERTLSGFGRASVCAAGRPPTANLDKNK